MYIQCNINDIIIFNVIKCTSPMYDVLHNESTKKAVFSLLLYIKLLSCLNWLDSRIMDEFSTTGM